MGWIALAATLAVTSYASSETARLSVWGMTDVPASRSGVTTA